MNRSSSNRFGLLATLGLGLMACSDEDAARNTNGSPAAPLATTPPASSAAETKPPPPPTDPATKATSTQGRLLIGDGDPENPRMMILDLDEGTITATFPTLGTPAAYRSRTTSRYAYANQRVHGMVEIIDSGVSVDGTAIAKQAPVVLAEKFEGLLPTHWVHHDQWIVSFNDGDGSFDYMLEPSIAGGRLLKQRARTARAHHGVALIAHGNVFATLPDPNAPAAALPIGVSKRRLATPDVIADQSSECPLLHGEAGNDDTVAFGCADGLLIAERSEGDFVFRKLAKPDGTADGVRVGTIRMTGGLGRIIVNWGNGIAIVDHHATPPAWTPVDFGASNVAFLVTEDGKYVVALDGAGRLRRYDAVTGVEAGAPLPLVEAWAAPQLRPALGLGDGKAFVADPRTGKVLEVDLATSTKQRTFDTGGMPSSVAAFARVTQP